MSLNTDALNEIYPNGLSDELQSHIERMQELSDRRGILSVTLLSNFGKDMEMSMKQETDIFRGLIVQTSSDYKLSEFDSLWLHPELCKGRSIYEGGNKQVSTPVEIDKFNSSVGIYSTHSIDEIGAFKQTTNTIVDSGMEDMSEVLTSNWMLGNSTMRKAYNEVVGAKLVKQAQQKRDEIAKEYGAKERLLTSNYNMLYSDGRTFYFYNHAIKPSNGKALLNISPLIGCAMITSEDKHVESDLLSSSSYIDINKLNSEQRSRAFESCKWEGKNIVNTYTMRKPLDNYKNVLEAHNVTMYRLENGYFSANPVHSKLPADIVLYLTPEKDLIPQAASCHQHIRDGSIDMPASVENIAKLMKNHWRELISKKYVSGDTLVLPREMVEESLV
tara:strand:- start:2196 stop:3359 length:1164 start_codon:yes stop_codon:yes gene_type:complete